MGVHIAFDGLCRGYLPEFHKDFFGGDISAVNNKLNIFENFKKLGWELPHTIRNMGVGNNPYFFYIIYSCQHFF